MSFLRPALLGLIFLAACAPNDLDAPPADLGDFVLGHNIVVADKMQKVPISRDATVDEWETAVKKAMADRFGRYEGSRIYNIGIAVEAYALAPPGIPVVAAPKSVLAISVKIWDDASGKQLNAKPEQMIIWENLDSENVVGTGFTRTPAEQMAALSYNAAKSVEQWLVKNPDWFEPAADAAADTAPVAAPKPAPAPQTPAASAAETVPDVVASAPSAGK